MTRGTFEFANREVEGVLTDIVELEAVGDGYPLTMLKDLFAGLRQVAYYFTDTDAGNARLFRQIARERPSERELTNSFHQLIPLDSEKDVVISSMLGKTPTRYAVVRFTHGRNDFLDSPYLDNWGWSVEFSPGRLRDLIIRPNKATSFETPELCEIEDFLQEEKNTLGKECLEYEISVGKIEIRVKLNLFVILSLLGK